MIKLDVNTSGKMKVETTTDYTLSDAVLLLLNAILFIVRRALEKVDPKVKEDTKKQMYDMLNLRFSGLLETFAPEYELRPNLTEAAILKAENEMLQDEMSKMQK